jgi:hypothetical protein
VVPGSQAEAAGLKRGDILCFAGSNGQEEMMYDMFLDMARSGQRPFGTHFIVLFCTLLYFTEYTPFLVSSFTNLPLYYSYYYHYYYCYYYII